MGSKPLGSALKACCYRLTASRAYPRPPTRRDGRDRPRFLCDRHAEGEADELAARDVANIELQGA